ncbi:phosphatidylethanolamine-binding protein 4 [Porphyrio hochstetteri]
MECKDVVFLFPLLVAMEKTSEKWASCKTKIEGIPLATKAVPSPLLPTGLLGNHLHGNLKHPGSASELLAHPQDLGRMKLLGAVLLAASLLSAAAQRVQAPWPDDPSQTCFFQMLSGVDKKFCRGDLEVIYPELGDVGCMYIPKCHWFRQRISREWSSPRVRYPQAEKSKKYVLVLVDPDAPSRANPWNRYWRHWLVTDIP